MCSGAVGRLMCAAVIVALAGCSGGAGAPPAPVTVTVTPGTSGASSSGPGASTGTSSTPALPGATSAPTAPVTGTATRSVRDVSGRDLYSFATPTGNIVCVLVGKGIGAASDNVRCTIRQKAWSSPARPASCELDYGTDLEVSSPGRGEFTCAGDTILGMSGQATVGYGTTVRMGQAACEVDSNGVTCRAGSHGFFIAKESYRLF